MACLALGTVGPMLRQKNLCHLDKAAAYDRCVLLPYKVKNPPESFPWITAVLIFINLLVFGVVNMGMPIPDDVAMTYGVSANNISPLTLLTSMFLHGDIWHILGNMWFLYLFGVAVEGRLKWWKFLLIYLLSGLGGDFLHLAMFGSAYPDVPSIGASGAIMGVMGAALYMFPFSRMMLFYWITWFFAGVTEWPLWGIALLYLGMDLFWAVLGIASGTGGGGGVANLAHLGGAAAGFLLCLAIRVPRDTAEDSDSKAHLDAVGDYRGLQARQLESMAAKQPENPDLTLHWVARSLNEGRPLTDPQIDRFRRHLPRLMREGDMRSLASCMANITATHPSALRPSDLLTAAIQVEKQGEPNVAMMLLNRVRENPHSTDSDLETATYRLGLIHESWHKNYAEARRLYEEFLAKWPFSPMEQTVKQRLAYVSSQAQKSW